MKVENAKAPDPGRAIRVQSEAGPIAVFNVDGRLLGVDAKCTHAGGPIDQARREGTLVTCPWHGSVFDLETGAVRRGPAIKPLKSYRVTIEGDGLSIDPV